MRIDQLGCDGFMEAVASALEAVSAIKSSKSGKRIVRDFSRYRGSLADVPEEDRNRAAGEWLVNEVLTAMPDLLREDGAAIVALLAALDGQTPEEYKEAFTPSKLVQDVRDAVSWAMSNVSEASAFLGR